MISKKGAAGVTAAVGSWLVAYYFIAEEIDKSSSIVNQSIFNININENVEKELKLPVKVASGVRGKMNQFKGFAEINFDVVDKTGSNLLSKYLLFYLNCIIFLDNCVVEVDAKRRGLNWKTTRLILRSPQGHEMNFI